MKSDLEIARRAELKPIKEIAAAAGIPTSELIPYGDYKAKVSLGALEKLVGKTRSRYVVVTAITPTPLGEGKTVTTVGLSQAFHRLGRKVFTCLRQPSQGPTFSIKGGAAGGGYSQVVPMEDFNLHLTGDIHAVGAANNLCAAAIDTRLMHERNYDDQRLERLGLKRLNIDPFTISWKRVLDVNDRSLRDIVIGLGGKMDGYPRRSGFEITVASEVMAILSLAGSLRDMRRRMGEIVVAFNRRGEPVTAEDLGVAGAMSVLCRDALQPNLMQTLEGSPVFVHTGPFANIAHGNSSVVADLIASRVADFVITESGFGADCGLEKFINIKCRVSGMAPDCVVLVASVRSLKMHGGGPRVRAGRSLDPAYGRENIELLRAGLANLRAHLETTRLFGLPAVVAVNRFPTDTDREVETVIAAAREAGAEAVESRVCAEGGKGGVDLAEAVETACEEKASFRFLYPLDAPIKEKIETIAARVYGAGKVAYSPQAESRISLYDRLGFDRLPVCMAKTHLSLSHDPNLKGAPRGFTLPVRDLEIAAGAGFITVFCGEIKTMPGLPSTPAFFRIDLDEKGEIKGLE